MTSIIVNKLAALGFLLLLPTTAGSQESVVRATEQQFHRNLAGFLLPFQISWRFEIFQGTGFPEDRQPTEAEYDGINEATIDFFTAEIPAFYATQADFSASFREIGCTTDTESYDPTAAEWQHRMTLLCDVTWDADTVAEIPTVERFLLDMNQPYLLDNFVDPYLRSADPQDPRSIFQFASRVGYTTQNSGTRGPLPGEDTPAPAVTDAPVMTTAPVTPTMAPVPAPTTLAPAPTTTAPAPTMAMPTATLQPQRKDAPPAKCGSLASNNDRGGAAADAKDCASGRNLDGVRRKRKLKGSNY